MDASQLGFRNNTFSVVIERASLHHVSEWRRVVVEMLRVSSGSVLIEEPIDDLRSEEKKNTFMAQGLFLELHSEVGYSHYRHLPQEELLSFLRQRASVIETCIERSDHMVPFEAFFESFTRFSARSSRRQYWENRLGVFRSSLGEGHLCEADTLVVLAAKS